MNQLAFLCGVPGAGKSTIKRSLRGESFECVELGLILKKMHKAMFPNQEFIRSSWTNYIKGHARDESMQNLFRNNTKQVDLKYQGLLIVGNQFLIEEVENSIVDVLVTQGSFDPPLKLFLDVDAETAYERRLVRKHQRNTKFGRPSPSDRKISRRRSKRQVLKFRKILPPRGWIPAIDCDATGTLKDFFRSERLP